IEGEQIFHPAWRVSGPLGLEFKRWPASALVGNTFLHSPGIDDLRYQAQQRGVLPSASQLVDQLRGKCADGRELEADITLVGKTGILRHPTVDLFAPGAQLTLRNCSVEPRGDDLGHQVADLRPGAGDDRAQAPHPLVEFHDPVEFISDRLRAWN